MGVFSVSGVKGGCTGSTEHREHTNMDVLARFSCSAGGDRWSSAKHKKSATWARFPCLAGRRGEGRHVGVSGIPVDGEVGGRGQAAGR